MTCKALAFRDLAGVFEMESERARKRGNERERETERLCVCKREGFLGFGGCDY